MKKIKITILIGVLFIILLLIGCSNSQVSKSEIRYNEPKIEENKEILIYTDKEEESLLLKSYNHGKNSYTLGSKNVFLPFYAAEILNIDVYDVYDDYDEDDEDDEDREVDIQLFTDRIESCLMNTIKFSDVTNEINSKFRDVMENESNISIEEVTKLKNKLLEKVCLAYKYGILDQAIDFTKNIKSSNFENRVSDIINSNINLNQNAVNMVKSELYKSCEQMSEILMSIKSNFGSAPIDESIKELDSIARAYYDFMSENLNNGSGIPGDVYNVFYDVYVNY